MSFICDHCGTKHQGINQIHIEGDVYMFCSFDCLKQWLTEYNQ